MSKHFILLTAADEARETVRDVLHQMAVHDSDRRVRHAAELAYRSWSLAGLPAIQSLAASSPYSAKLAAAIAEVTS